MQLLYFELCSRTAPYVFLPQYNSFYNAFIGFVDYFYLYKVYNVVCSNFT